MVSSRFSRYIRTLACCGCLVLGVWIEDLRGEAESSSAEIERLFSLADQWRIEEAYPGDEDKPEGYIGKGQASFRKSLGDSCLIGEYRSKCRELGTDVEGHSIFTYDDESGTYRYWWFDNYGNASEFSGKYVSKKNAIVLLRKDDQADPKTPTDRYRFKFEDEDTVKFTWEAPDDEGRYELVMSVTYTRKVSRKPTLPKEKRRRRPAGM